MNIGKNILIYHDSLLSYKLNECQSNFRWGKGGRWVTDRRWIKANMTTFYPRRVCKAGSFLDLIGILQNKYDHFHFRDEETKIQMQLHSWVPELGFQAKSFSLYTYFVPFPFTTERIGYFSILCELIFFSFGLRINHNQVLLLGV